MARTGLCHHFRYLVEKPKSANNCDILQDPSPKKKAPDDRIWTLIAACSMMIVIAHRYSSKMNQPCYSHTHHHTFIFEKSVLLRVGTRERALRNATSSGR